MANADARVADQVADLKREIRVLLAGGGNGGVRVQQGGGDVVEEKGEAVNI